MKTHVEVGGVLRADGTILLDERPDLPAGPVRVTLQVAANPPPEGQGWWEFLQQLRADQLASGYVPRTDEEIQAQIDEMDRIDEEGDRRFDQMHEESMAQWVRRQVPDDAEQP